MVQVAVYDFPGMKGAGRVLGFSAFPPERRPIRHGFEQGFGAALRRVGFVIPSSAMFHHIGHARGEVRDDTG